MLSAHVAKNMSGIDLKARNTVGVKHPFILQNHA